MVYQQSLVKLLRCNTYSNSISRVHVRSGSLSECSEGGTAFAVCTGIALTKSKAPSNEENLIGGQA